MTTLFRRRARRVRRGAAILLLGVLLAPTALAAGEDFQVTLTAGAEPVFEGPGVGAELVAYEPGERAEWRLTSAPTRLVGVIDVRGWADVDRVRQVVPSVDERFFVEIPGTVDDAAEWSRVVNRTGRLDAFTYRVAFPINATTGGATLVIARDVAPPGFSVGNVTNVTHFSFYVETTTTEHALADLQIRPAAGGDTVRNPTTAGALLQRFPVQGLAPARAYVFFVEFEDWAGNRARSPDVAVTTAARPTADPPRVLARFPEPDAQLDAAPPYVGAEFEAGAGTIDPAAHVRLFVDRREVTSEIVADATSVRYAPPGGFAPGYHPVGLELANSAGGNVAVQWAFTVSEPAASSPGVGALGTIAALGVGLGLRRRP